MVTLEKWFQEEKIWSKMAAAIGIAKTATEIFLGVGTVSVDNLTFQLHYRWSVTLFIVCSVLVQTSQFFGDPVQCETVSKEYLLKDCFWFTGQNTFKCHINKRGFKNIQTCWIWKRS